MDFINIDQPKIKWGLFAFTAAIYISIASCSYAFYRDMRTIASDYSDFQETQLNNVDTSSSLSPNQVLQWQLLGSADPASLYSAQRLSVIGIFMASIPELQAVVIAEDEANPKLYAIGDALPGHYILKTIYPDRVILQSSHNTEVLYYGEKPHSKALVNAPLTNTAIDLPTIQKALPYGGDPQFLEKIRKEQLHGTKP